MAPVYHAGMVGAGVAVPPHSRFHPVPTRPVFDNRQTAAEACLTPAADPLEVLPPPLLGPQLQDGEPSRLPIDSASPIRDYDPLKPSSRRR